jgi:hypothetical protein
MNDHNHGSVIDVLARYAPTPGSVSHEWTTARSGGVLTAIVGDLDGRTDASAGPPAYEIPLQLAPTRPLRAGKPGRGWSSISPVAASVAVLALAAGTVVALLVSHGSDHDPSTGGAAFDPPAELSTVTLSGGQYSHRVDQQIQLDADGTPLANAQDAMVNRNWVSTNGDILSVRTGSQHRCANFRHSGDPNFEDPTLSFFASLPTGADALNEYMRDHVAGSSSRDEAVFVAVGDALRTADGLASPQLRGAFVAVLSRTAGVVVHEDQRDYLGRPAVRADFVDQRIRPGEIQSLYFDPSTFQLLEGRESSNSQPQTYTGPSPAYDAAPEPGDDPDELSGAAFIDVMTSEAVVDTLPTLTQPCIND